MPPTRKPRAGCAGGDRPSRLHALLDGAPALTPESVPPESVPPVVAIGASTASACRALNLRYVHTRFAVTAGFGARRCIPHVGASLIY